jgi:hypothetical protein
LDQPSDDSEERRGSTDGEQARREEDTHLRAERLEHGQRGAEHDEHDRQQR